MFTVKKRKEKRKCKKIYKEEKVLSGVRREKYFFKRRIVNSQEPLQKRKQRGE